MHTFQFTVTDESGIHARPAGQLINKVKSTGAKVTVSKNGKDADATKLFALMALAVKKGDTITVTVDGSESIAKEIESFFRDNL